MVREGRSKTQSSQQVLLQKESVSAEIGDFNRNINRLPTGGAKTWHLFKKDNSWKVAVSFTPILAIARRGMRLSEKLPDSITAYVEVNSNKHVWTQWAELNRKAKQSGRVNRRHDYYTVSNWSFLVNPKEV